MQKRLINCNFVNSGSFSKISNKAKLLYLMFLLNADDKGFVDNSNDIIEKLNRSDMERGDNSSSLLLLNNDYVSALNELIERGYLIAFANNHGDFIYLVSHWYFHQEYTSKTKTNYYNFFQQVQVVNGQYEKREKPLKEKKLKEININENNINEMKEKEVTPSPTESTDEWDKMINDLKEEEE